MSFNVSTLGQECAVRTSLITCAAGYTGNPQLGQRCSVGNNDLNGNCYNCDQRGSEGCNGNGVCRCKGTFHISTDNKDGCLSCFCMGVTQQCSSSSNYRDQRTNRISTGFTVEVSTDGTQLSYSNFDYLGQEPHYWQLPGVYQGDKKEAFFARMRRAHQRDSPWIEEQLRKDASIWVLMKSLKGNGTSRSKRASQEQVKKLDDEIWEMISNFGDKGSPPFPPSSSSSSSSSERKIPSHSYRAGSRTHLRPHYPSSSPSGISSLVRPTRPQPASPGPSPRLQTKPRGTKNIVGPPSAPSGPRPAGVSSLYALVYKGFSLHPDDTLYWQLPDQFKGDKVSSYGGKLKYTISYVAGPRGTAIEDADVQIIGNDITLVARQPWQRGQGTRESRQFEVVFREENWRRPDGMPATREHLMMVLADLDDILVRASYYTEMRSSSISEDCAPGYTRTGGGLYLGHCELCECNGHSDSCHPETGICTGALCEQCAPGFFGDPTAGTPEDCQPCACPHTDPDNQFSPICESLGNGGYHCAPGYVGNPQDRIKCRPFNTVAASLVVKVYPERVLVAQGSPVTLRCQVTGSPPHYYYWSREDGRPITNSADRRRQGEELHIPSVQPSDAGIYVCTCRDQRNTNRSRAEIVVRTVLSKPIEVTIEEPKAQSVTVGAAVSFICTAKSKSPAYTLVWTRQGNGKLPNRAMDFNGILTIQNVQPEDAGIYVCTGSNMFAMDEGTAVLYVPEASQTQMFYTAYEMFEGHGKPAEGAQPVATVNPPVLTIQQGGRAEFRCTVTGNPTPAIEWIGGGPGNRMSPNAVVRGGVLTIPAVERGDEGEYVCKALNTHGEHTARAVLYVSPQRVDIHEGETLRLYCRAGGTPSPGLTWKKQGGQLPPQARMERTDIGTLLIPNIKSSDSGTYLSIGGDTISSAITIQPSIADVQEGQSLDLNCFVPGNPPPAATWNDSGEYICRVEAGPGTPVRQASVSVSVTATSSRLQTPIISIEPHSAAVRQGESASFKCRVYSGAQPVRLEWKLSNNQPLPDNVKIDHYGTVLIITDARPSNQGTYRCVASNLFGITQSIVSLIVKESPVATVTPQGPVRVRVGEPINLECQASGEPRPSVTWHRLDNARKTMLSSPVPMESNAVMQVLVARPEDSGTYVCMARNNEGTTETRVEVIVEGGAQVPTSPRASVPEPLVVVVEGQTTTLRCDAHGFPAPNITWSKLRAPLPWRHKVVDNTLVLPRVGWADSGEYISPPYATSLPDDVAVRVGEVIRLQCLAHGTPPLLFQWTKLNGSLSTRADAQAGDLQINLATAEDAGTYKCVATNKVGTRGLGTTIEWLKEGGALPPNHHIKDGVLRATSVHGQAQDTAKLTIQALPKVMINVRTSVQTVMVGNSVEFECQAIGEPQPTVRWSKVGGLLPAHIVVKGGMLKIEQVTEADAGQYRCTATNDVGSVQSQVVLNVQSLPQIAALPELKEVTVGSDAVLPCVASGYPVPAIKWSKLDGELPPKCIQVVNTLSVPGVTHEDSGTYVCTASNKQGKVEAFTTLKVHDRVMPYFTQEPLSYLTLPTIKNAYKSFSIKISFRPDNPDGMIIYNGQKRTMGADFISLGLGKFQGLDLNEELYVGGYPNYTLLAKTASLKTGFIGCIRKLVIQGDEVIFKDLDRSSTGVSNCPVCTDSPCQNGGICQDSDTSLYKCSCPRGFTGSNCQHHSSLHCHPEACGPDATCINRQNTLGYDCRCHLGKSGNKCMDGELVTTPLFDGMDSYIAYPPLTNIHNDLHIEMEFKPMDLDGLMFFSVGKKMKTEDFVSLEMVDGHVQFCYELGTGQAVLRSPEPVTLGQWHRVEAGRLDKDGSLKVDGGREVRRSSPGKAQGLNIHTPMYLGGVPNMDIIPKALNISDLYDGCIGEVSINGKKVDLSYSFTDSMAIVQCKDNSPCDRNPCLNGASCMPSAEYEYQCLCKDGFEGERCEVGKDTCQSSDQCQNGGSCVNSQCVCPIGFNGPVCGQSQVSSFAEALGNLEGSGGNDAPIEYAAEFYDNGYLSLPKTIFPRSYQLGSGESQIQSREPINDGRWHKVTAVRTGKQGYIQIDGGAIRRGQSQGKSIMVNTKGNVYLGGAPDISAMTGGKFSSGLEGCGNLRGEHAHSLVTLLVEGSQRSRHKAVSRLISGEDRI
ncbi:unnamed protein product [Coregonus sp. 'balchen']|nr:unnamed protein product [Coregonus sp. 'balchen']